MTTQPIRAVYRAGLLRPLDPLDLPEGEEVSLVILSDDERVRAALGDLLAEPAERTPEDTDLEALMRSLTELSPMQPPLSETILEERRSGL